MPELVVLMGVSGSGKSTLAKAAALAWGWACYDADDFHSPESLAKMRAGQALDDADREPWLEKLAALLRGCLARHERAFLACSALKESYRRRLGLGSPGVKLVYLKGSKEEIQKRLDLRQGHFMQPSLLQSQFDILEEPSSALVLDIGLSSEEKILRMQQAFFQEQG